MRNLFGKCLTLFICLCFLAACGNNEQSETTTGMKTEGTKASSREIITLGNYGGSPIEWEVLAKEGGKMLLISRYGLDAKPFHVYSGEEQQLKVFDDNLIDVQIAINMFRSDHNDTLPWNASDLNRYIEGGLDSLQNTPTGATYTLVDGVFTASYHGSEKDYIFTYPDDNASGGIVSGFLHIRWGNSTLRAWLNGEFFEQSFSEEERGKILQTSVQYKKESDSKMESEKDTQDWLFLLNWDEIKTYFTSQEDRICYPTELAKKNGCSILEDTGGCYWWLNGSNTSIADIIDPYGGVTERIYLYDGDIVTTVRPVLWYAP